MDFKQLDRGEVIATAGGVLLAISIFLPWYSLGNANAALGGCHGPHTSCSAWNALSVIRVLLLLAAFAPVILAWIIIRWWVALLGGLLILTGSIWRSRESAARRKPPGVL